MSEPKWYVLKVVNGQEKKVKAHLEREISKQKLEEHILQVLIPTEKVYEMRAGKKRTRARNFFPGYMLVYADLSHGETSNIVRSIPGVLGFLTAKGWSASKVPEPLRKEEVNRILGKVGEAENLEAKLEKPFIVGEAVKVVDGPFSGFTGNIQEVLEDRKKLNVMVKIFGRNTPIELHYIQVEKLG
ncbi:MAG: transcription termination/antitermination protein NusG [Cytophagales bacterium]|nr:transcription termination/antitermination protein NusG [Cytophagales bacterium]